jgi:hypothetical protein
MELTQDLHASPRLAWDVTERLLVRMRDDSTKNGARFAVITFPWVDDATNRLLVRAREIIDRNRLAHIDLGPALSGRMAALLDPATQHWTPQGHRAVADAFAPALADLLGKASEPASGPRGAAERFDAVSVPLTPFAVITSCSPEPRRWLDRRSYWRVLTATVLVPRWTPMPLPSTNIALCDPTLFAM